MMIDAHSREEWLLHRLHGIGGSDAGTVLGVNKYKTNVQLWREKTGQLIPEDISDKPAVKFGKVAEEHLRALFVLDYPEYEVSYHEFGMHYNPERPWLYATLDVELLTGEGKRGILEIKTCTIQNKSQWDEWDDRIPDSYYAQLLHQLAATGWDFAILKAYIRYYRDGELKVSIRHYRIDRSEVESDIEFLIQEEEKFWKCVKSGVCPAQKLPQI